MTGAKGARRKEMVIPPFRFGIVEADVFRSAQPTLKNFRYLSRLKIRTVVAIAPEGPMEDEAMFCRAHAAQLLPIRAELYRDEAVTVTFQQVAQVLSVLVDAERLPALVHCPDGRVLVGVVMWCLRRLQCWDSSAAAAEFTRFCGVLPTRDVKKYVEDFGDEITVPENVPRWLWGGDREHWHPSIRIRHQPPLKVVRTEPCLSQKAFRDEIQKTLADARADYLRIRGGHIDAHKKLQQGASGGSGRAGSGGLAGAGHSARRSLNDLSRGLFGQYSFAQDMEDINAMMEDERLSTLSRTVQALSLEGLDITGQSDVAAYGEMVHEQQQQQQQQQRGRNGSSRGGSRARTWGQQWTEVAGDGSLRNDLS